LRPHAAGWRGFRTFGILSPPRGPHSFGRARRCRRSYMTVPDARNGRHRGVRPEARGFARPRPSWWPDWVSMVSTSRAARSFESGRPETKLNPDIRKQFFWTSGGIISGRSPDVRETGTPGCVLFLSLTSGREDLRTSGVLPAVEPCARLEVSVSSVALGRGHHKWPVPLSRALAACAILGRLGACPASRRGPRGQPARRRGDGRGGRASRGRLERPCARRLCWPAR